MAATLSELDDHVTFAEQLQQETGPIVLINTFTVAAEDVDRLIETWAQDAAYMKRQPGFISTQLHRGLAGSTTLVNVAVWESSQALRLAFFSSEFQTQIARYPASTVTQPHVFEKIAVPGICVS